MYAYWYAFLSMFPRSKCTRQQEFAAADDGVIWGQLFSTHTYNNNNIERLSLLCHPGIFAVTMMVTDYLGCNCYHGNDRLTVMTAYLQL